MASEENTPLLNGYEKKTQEKKGCCKTNIFGPEIVVVLFALYAAPVVITEEQFLYSLLQHEYTFINKSTDILFIRNDDAFSANEFEMDVQARASQIMLILTVTTSVLSMVSSLFYGSLSDAKGRKLILIVSLVGSVIKILTLLIVSVLKISYWVLVFGHVIDGVTGSYQTLLTGCFAYGADISKTEKRTLKVALLESCLGVAGAVGTISTGYITDRLGYTYTFSTLFGFGLLNLFYTICILPRATHKEGPIHIHHFYNYIYDGLKLYFKDNGTKRRWKLQYNIVLALIILIVITAKTDSQTYFLKGKPLELDEIPVGYYSGWLILVQYLGCILAVVGLGPRLGDHWLIVIGCLCATMYFIYFAFVAQLWMLITAPIIGLFGILPIPMIRSISSKLVEPYEQGAMFAVIGCVEALAQLVGTSLYNSIYSNTISFLPGFVFLVMAAQVFIALVMSVLQIYLLNKERFHDLARQTPAT